MMDYIKSYDILEEIYAERCRQNRLWGVQTHHQVIWLAILGEEYGEVCSAICELTTTNFDEPQLREKITENLREELTHVAAVAIAMIESLDDNGVEGKR